MRVRFVKPGHSLLAWFACAWAFAFGQAQEMPKRDAAVLLVVGASGTDEYGAQFAEQVKVWTQACELAGIKAEMIGTDKAAETPADAKQLEERLKTLGLSNHRTLWLVLIGHGTFDGREAKFNLRGPDVTPAELAAWLKPLQHESVIIHNGSAAGSFLKPLSGPNRIVVTATKSGDEVFLTRFGQYFAPAIAGSKEADIDRDGQVSVLEAFLHASKKVADFYEQEGRIATEHALIEDNGDGVGTRVEAFDGTRSKEAKADGARARQVCLVLSDEEARLTDAQRATRDDLERKVEELKERRVKEKLTDDQYYTELEKLLRELAALYQGT